MTEISCTKVAGRFVFWLDESIGDGWKSLRNGKANGLSTFIRCVDDIRIPSRVIASDLYAPELFINREDYPYGIVRVAVIARGEFSIIRGCSGSQLPSYLNITYERTVFRLVDNKV